MKQAAFFLSLSLVVISVFAEDSEVPDVVFPAIPKMVQSDAEFRPYGWIIEERIIGDLNADSLPDVVIVLHMTDKNNLITNSGLGLPLLDTNPRMLVIAFANHEHGYTLKASDHTLIPRHINPVLDDPFIDAKIVRGTLRVTVGFWASAGSWHMSNSTYTLRLQDNCFRLIGYDHNETHRGTGEISTVSVNYLTKKVKLLSGNIADDTLEEEWKPLAYNRMLCLEEIGDGVEFRPEL